MKTQNQPVLSTKNVNQVPFKNELIGQDVSPKLLFAAGNNKSYRQVVHDCDDPEVLHEIMVMKRNNPNFPTLKKIRTITRVAGFAAAVTVLFKGRKFASQVKCSVYRIYLPKKQHTDAV